MLFWFVVFFMSDEDDQQSLWTKEEKQRNLRLRVFLLLIFIAFSFAGMLGIARLIRNHEKVFNVLMYTFLLFIVSCEFGVFLSIMKMVKVQYGNEFRRKVFV